MSYRDVRVACPTATMGRAVIERGVPAERVSVIRPGVDFARVRARRDPALRAALGFDEGHEVMLAIGESTCPAAHHLVTWAGTILNVLDRRTRVLLWGRGPAARSAARLGTKMGHPDLVTSAECRLGRSVELEELTPAADVLVVGATGPVSTLPVAIAMAANLPIVAAVTPTVAELLEDRHTALMTPPGAPKWLAHRARELRADPELRRQLADRARAEAYEFFSQTRFLDDVRAAYAGVPQRDAPPGVPLVT
jgi:glycosyltransferase involved in cell wall biosynthesis